MSPCTDHTNAAMGSLCKQGAACDAARLTVEAAEAAYRLAPGQKVGVINGKAYPLADHFRPLGYGPDFEYVAYRGVVDPFLTCWVELGDRFWLLLAPHISAPPRCPDSTQIGETT